MIEGIYFGDALTIEESEYPFYGEIRKVDYGKETVRYAIGHFRWFTALVRHTVVSIGRGLFAASDTILGRILNNFDKDIITEALYNVAEQADFEQDMNYYSSPEDADKAMESYIGKMISYTATEWVRIKLQDFDRCFSFESIIEEKGDKILADIAKEFGLEDTAARELVSELNEIMMEEFETDTPEMPAPIVDEELRESEMQGVKAGLNSLVFEGSDGSVHDARLCAIISVTIFAIMQDLIVVSDDSVCNSLVESYKNSSVYIMTSERQEDSRTIFLGTIKYGLAISDVCGYGALKEDTMMTKLGEVFDMCSMTAFAKYGVQFLESKKYFNWEER